MDHRLTPLMTNHLISPTEFFDHPSLDSAEKTVGRRLFPSQLRSPERPPPEVREQQLVGHLLRLKELHFERFSLLEKIAQYLFRQRCACTTTEKHKEAALRTTNLKERLHKLMDKKLSACLEENVVSEAHSSSSSRVSSTEVSAVCSLIELRSASTQVLKNLLENVIMTIMGNDSTTMPLSFSQTLLRWLQFHYVSIFQSRYLPMVFTLTATKYEHSIVNKIKENALQNVLDSQLRREERQRARERRRVQLMRAKEQLERANKNAFTVRKRIFLLHEWVTGNQQLPNGHFLSPVVSKEILHRIRADLSLGEIDLLLQLTNDNGRILQHMTV